MKHFFEALLFFCCIVFFIACSKSSSGNTSTSVAQMPFQTAAADKNVVTIKAAYSQATGGAEVGYRLHFTKSGNITGLGAEMATAGTYQVSFWRTSDQSLLATAAVVISDTSHFFYTAITSVPVIVDTEYTVSLHIPDGGADAHWIYYNSPFNDIYPFTEGNVVADQTLDLIGLTLNTATPTYPYTVYSSDQGYLGADCDIVYKPDAD